MLNPIGETPVQRNIEIKVQVDDLTPILQASIAIGAQDHGVLRQRDTYFHAPSSRRLKLRQHHAGGDELIFYQRPDAACARPSDYQRIAITDTAMVLRVFSRGLGVLGVVEKSRRLFVIDGVRIHLDDVDGLGRFVELEGVVGAIPGGEQEARKRVERLDLALRLTNARPVSGSYCDLLMTNAGGR